MKTADAAADAFVLAAVITITVENPVTDRLIGREAAKLMQDKRRDVTRGVPAIPTVQKALHFQLIFARFKESVSKPAARRFAHQLPKAEIEPR